MKNKPDILYRGRRIRYERLQNFKFTGVDLRVTYPPIIDEYGRKTVTDGNEYGVYMSDNLSMVQQAYGKSHNDGTIIHKNLEIYNRTIMIPAVAIIYKIDTKGLDIREPFITSYLKRGHYNNGMVGTEWIADVIPANNYSLNRVRIGEDILHEEEEIDLSKTQDVEKLVKEIVEGRKQRLEIFAEDMEKLSPMQRRRIGESELNILKSIYGENGLYYIDENNLNTNNVEEMLKYLAIKSFRQSLPNIDFQTLKYINSLKGQVINTDSIIETLKNDAIKNGQDKIAFVERKKKEGVPYVTSKFDSQEKRLNQLMSMIFIRQRKDKQTQTQINNHTNENKTKENPEWEIKYNEIEPEIIEQTERSM